MHTPQLRGHSRVVEWVVELIELSLHFVNTHAIKSRAMDDFVEEWTPVPDEEEEGLSLDLSHAYPNY